MRVSRPLGTARNELPPDWLILQDNLFVWESSMTFRQFALPLAALIALGADVRAQENASRSDGSDASQVVFNNACRTCHTLRDGDNRLGPNLHKIIGRRAGSLPNYGYSGAMKDADVVWDKATLDRFIAN